MALQRHILLTNLRGVLDVVVRIQVNEVDIVIIRCERLCDIRIGLTAARFADG